MHIHLSFLILPTILPLLRPSAYYVLIFNQKFTPLVLRPHPEFTMDPGAETCENIFEKLLSLHDLVFHGLIGNFSPIFFLFLFFFSFVYVFVYVFAVESLTKQQTVTMTPKVPEIEDVLANELAIVVQTLIAEKKLVFTPVSKSDIKYLDLFLSPSSLFMTLLIRAPFSVSSTSHPEMYY